MSKGAVIGGVAIAAVVGLGAAGYYWTLKGELPAPGSGGFAASHHEAGGCEDDAIKSKVMELVRSRGLRTNLLVAASEQKLVLLRNVSESTEASIQVDGIKHCIDAAMQEEKTALQNVGLTNIPLTSDSETNCSLLLSPKEGYLCYETTKPIQAKKAACASEFRQRAYEHSSTSVLDRDAQRIKAATDAKYDVRYIRLTSLDQATGSKICTGQLQATLPADWGSAAEDISYKIEKTSESDYYITLLNVDRL